MRGTSRSMWVATFGIAAFALGFLLVRAQPSPAVELRGEPLYVAARDGAVGQPQRLFAATLQRLRLRLPHRRRDL